MMVQIYVNSNMHKIPNSNLLAVACYAMQKRPWYHRSSSRNRNSVALKIPPYYRCRDGYFASVRT
jgi:hypothetical protein